MKLPLLFYNSATLNQVKLTRTHLEISRTGTFYMGTRYTATRGAVRKALKSRKSEVNMLYTVYFLDCDSSSSHCTVEKSKTVIHFGCQIFRGLNAKRLRTWARGA